MPERPPKCRTAEIACSIYELNALPPKLAGKGVSARNLRPFSHAFLVYE